MARVARTTLKMPPDFELPIHAFPSILMILIIVVHHIWGEVVPILALINVPKPRCRHSLDMAIGKAEISYAIVSPDGKMPVVPIAAVVTDREVGRPHREFQKLIHVGSGDRNVAGVGLRVKPLPHNYRSPRRTTLRERVHFVVILDVLHDCQQNLLFIRDARGSSSFLPCLRKHRKQNCCQYCYNCDYYEKLYKCEASPCLTKTSEHLICPFRGRGKPAVRAPETGDRA